MCVKVDRNADLLLERPDQQLCSVRFAQTGHVLDGQNVSAHLFEFLRHRDVILQIVLRPSGIKDVAGVADDGFADCSTFVDRVHRDLHVGNPVQRIEDAEHVDAGVGGLGHKRFDHVVGIVCVADGVRRAQQHLKQDVGNPLTHRDKPLPRTLLEESHRSVKRRAAPHFDRKELGAKPRVSVGNPQEVMRTHPSRQQRLVRVAKGGVRDEQGFALKNPLRELFRSKLEKPLTHPVGDRRQIAVHGKRSRCAARRLRVTFHQRIAVNNRLSQIREQLCRSVPTRGEVEQLRRFVDETGRAVA